MNDTPGQHVCPYCDKVFEEYTELRSHMQKLWGGPLGDYGWKKWHDDHPLPDKKHPYR
jgi:hypothetical protein